ncbi:MAG: 4Fe-4S binding protein [Romboutsia sp.]
MSRDWYPVINYKKCDACGACIEICIGHGFKTSKP